MRLATRKTLSVPLAALQLSLLLAACAGPSPLLPHSLYFIARVEERGQIWRLERDGITLRQITDEAVGVDDFAVSPADGAIAIVTDNRLFVVGGDSESRKLIADGNLVDERSDDFAHRCCVGSPVFSPDGRTLAYAFDGLHLYDTVTGQDEHVLSNLGNLLGEPFVFTRENYAPGPWSPDGRTLLIVMAYMEGSTLAVMEPGAAEPFRRLWSDGPVCCTYHWAPDARSVLVANASFGVHWPGLWRYDAESGEEHDLVTTVPGSPQFVGWPIQLPSGDLLYFHGEQFSPEEGVALALVRSGPDGRDPRRVRPEEFHICDALWAPDGSLAVILQVDAQGSRQTILVRPDGSPVRFLLEGIHIQNPAWGP